MITVIRLYIGLTVIIFLSQAGIDMYASNHWATYIAPKFDQHIYSLAALSEFAIGIVGLYLIGKKKEEEE